MISKIIVNATALRTSGALTILYQFIDNIPSNSKHKYLIFINRNVKTNDLNPNIQFVTTDITSFKDRFLWDAFFLKRWLKKNGIIPVSTLSLQNTNFNVGYTCPNFIYYHQSLPFFKNKWNFLKKKERVLWFYKVIYPFFVKLFIKKNTEVFVQLNFIKEGFIKRFKFSQSKIHVVFPNVEIPNDNRTRFLLDIDPSRINCFYPSTCFFYKNHQLILNALKNIDKSITKKITLYLTLDRQELEFLSDFTNVEIVFLGKISYLEVLWIYQNVDLLLFPSYIETLGLPLLEAAYFGLPIFASDLPFAKEVLDGYDGVTFLDYTDSQLWGKKIVEFSNSKKIKYKSFNKEEINSWTYLIKKITEKK